MGKLDFNLDLWNKIFIPYNNIISILTIIVILLDIFLKQFPKSVSWFFLGYWISTQILAFIVRGVVYD